MSKETTKTKPYREIYGDFEKYLHGKGLDIGGGPDPLVVKDGSVDVWDLQNGDGEKLDGIKDETYDFVYSSHCLEHLKNIENAIKNWSRVIKKGGFLYFCVPDFELYEKRNWPSVFGAGEYGHLHSFSLISKREKVKRDNHYNVLIDLLPIIKENNITPLEVRYEINRFNFLLPNSVDQTLGNAQTQICFIGRKV